jgi:heterotetrameric sarcosine oxidase gamma subunit
LHDRLIAAGAVMGERVGWEFPLYFAPGNTDGVESVPSAPSFGYQVWSPHVERECLAARDAAVLIDQSCYGKLLVSGPDAVKALNHLSANEMDVPVGRSVYTQWLNSRGGIEAELTITRWSEEEFLVITGHPSQIRDRAWFQAHVDPGWHVQCHDVTSAYAMLSISGPASRKILQALTDVDLSTQEFPFGVAKYIDLGLARAWVLRRSFLGELGYEIYPSTDFARHIYEELLRVGVPHGLVHGGFLAMNHCRLEKGFVHFGHDIAEDDTPFEAGLKFAVALDKPDDFIGRDALMRQHAAGVLSNRLVNVRLRKASLHEGPYLLRNEPIWQGAQIVGYVTSGAWGFRLGGSFGLAAMQRVEGVTAAWLAEGGFEVEVAGVRHAADLQFGGFYDPKSQRLRG